MTLELSALIVPQRLLTYWSEELLKRNLVSSLWRSTKKLDDLDTDWYLLRLLDGTLVV